DRARRNGHRGLAPLPDDPTPNLQLHRGKNLIKQSRRKLDKLARKFEQEHEIDGRYHADVVDLLAEMQLGLLFVSLQMKEGILTPRGQVNLDYRATSFGMRLLSMSQRNRLAVMALRRNLGLSPSVAAALDAQRAHAQREEAERKRVEHRIGAADQAL